MISSVAENVIIRNDWREINIRIYNFFRVSVSSARCFWLAIIIRGRSHAVRIRSGVERGSEKKVNEWVNPTSSV